MSSNPDAKAIVISGEQGSLPGNREFRRRMSTWLVAPPYTYASRIEEALQQRPDLLIIDELSRESVSSALDAARDGLLVLTQFDTALWGAEVARQLLLLGASADQLAGLAWVFSVQRISRLCPSCRQAEPLDPARLEHLRRRYPHLLNQVDQLAATIPGEGKTGQIYGVGGCRHCNGTGRQGDAAVFDVFRSTGGVESLDERLSLLPLEESVLYLISQGQLPLDDLFNLEADQVRRTYNLLTASGYALSDANTQLERKLAELEAANRVLLQRTEVLISLQDVAQALITSSDLSDLAARICQRASDLCAADRAILYYLGTPHGSHRQVEILAVRGWERSLIGEAVDAGLVLDPHDREEPTAYADWPPGVNALTAEDEGEDKKVVIQAGLRMPLFADEAEVGVMIVQSTHQKVFAPGEVALLRTYANQAALAIQRAGLIDELRAKIAQLEAAQAGLVMKERMERELELAREVQQSVLPRTFPHVSGYTFAARNEPARQVGGDFYDVFSVDEAHVGLVIADVSDKGLPAALYMALTRSLILAEARREPSPHIVLQNVNNLLLELGEGRMYVSVFYGVLDLTSRRLIFTRAGHDRPVLLREGSVDALSGEGTVLGILEEDELHLTEEQLQLQPEDRLVLYTDGLIDVLDSEERFYDLNRLECLLQNNANHAPSAICTAIFEALDAYKGEAEQFDDMTMLVIEVQ
jgi:serine phosphatase RsbU (regulator of sigma subunit)